MENVKLNAWRQLFLEEASVIEMEFQAFFDGKRLSDYYQLSTNESDELVLSISSGLPNEVEERLQQAFIMVKPEDWIMDRSEKNKLKFYYGK